MQSPLELFIRAKVKNPRQEEIDSILSLFGLREFKKGEIFKASHTISKELAYILTGSARIFVINSRGDEVTSSIVREHQFFADLISVRANQATPLILHFVEDSTALVASIEAHKELIETNLAYNILIREHLAEEAMNFYKRQILFVTGNSRDRYQFIVDNDPQLLKRFPLRFIASMIGITPTQLSRIRNKKE